MGSWLNEILFRHVEIGIIDTSLNKSVTLYNGNSVILFDKTDILMVTMIMSPQSDLLLRRFFSWQDDISGDYRKIILGLVGEEQYLKKK